MFHKAPAWLLVTVLLLGLPIAKALANDDSLIVPAMGARSQAMGGTGVASTYDLSPAFNNPALLAFSTPWSTAFTFRHLSNRIRGISLYANGPCPRKQYTWGLGIDAVSATRRTWPGGSSALRNWRVQGTIAVARRVYDELTVGVALKPARWKLYGEKSSSFETDLGVAYPTRWHDVDIVVGAVVRDFLSSDVTRLDHDTAIDVSALLGVAGHYATKDSMWEFSAAVDLAAIERDFIADPQGRFRVGGEAAWHRFAGYRLAARMGHDGEHVTFGLGFDWRFLRVDWAKTAWSKWEHGQNITLSVDPLGVREYLFDVFGEPAPIVNWRDSVGVYRHEQFTHYDSSAQATFEAAGNDTAQLDDARTFYQNARVFADDQSQVLRTDSGVVRSEAALDRSRKVADSLVRDSQSGGLSQAERNLIDGRHGQLLDRADACYRRSDYVCASELIDLVLATDSTNSDALQLKASVERGRALDIGRTLSDAKTAEFGDYLGQALEAYLHILELDSLHRDGHTGKHRVENRLAIQRHLSHAVRAYRVGWIAQASAAFDSAAALDPSLIGLQNVLSGFNTNSADSISLDEIKSDSAAYRFYVQGLEFNRNQEYEKAIDAFNQVLQKYPNSPAVIKERDQALLMLQ